MRVKESITRVPPYIPGKSPEEIAEKYGVDKDKVVKLASNENPLGCSPEVEREVCQAARDVWKYPDPEAKELVAELKEYLGVASEIVVGNGSDDMLEQLAKLFIEPGREAIITPPTFSYYGILVKMYGGTLREVPLVEKDVSFEFNIDALCNAISRSTAMVFLCSPNNPTGNLLSGLEEVLETGVMTVVDEAYAEFSGKSFVELTESYSNLAVTRTFSKAFGLAGVRLGYCVCSPELKELIMRVRQPFSVSLLAQKAGIAALRDKEHLRRSVELARKGREFIVREARKIGIKAYNSETNFVLMRHEKGAEIVEELMKSGIIVRGCASFPGLNEEYFRVSIGTEEQNRLFISRLKEVLNKQA